MKLYSYILRYDHGFAPNPFFGYCTLACCKPDIRRVAKAGDWIVGLTPKSFGHEIAYYMKVSEVIPNFDAYWRDARFKLKRPNPRGDALHRSGDNIYEPLGEGKYRQLPSWHSRPPFTSTEDPQEAERDLGGLRVLVSKDFAYFGSNPVPRPPSLECLIIGEKHRSNFSPEQQAAFLDFVRNNGCGGCQAPPRELKSEDCRSLVSSHCAGTSRPHVPEAKNPILHPSKSGRCAGTLGSN